MKRLSIRAKITLWFALAMSVLAALTLGCVWMISDNVVQKNIKDSPAKKLGIHNNQVRIISYRFLLSENGELLHLPVFSGRNSQKG